LNTFATLASKGMRTRHGIAPASSIALRREHGNK
jgi:hypothetical protein